MIAAVGHSEDLNSSDAIAETLDQCAETLAGKTPQAGLLYAGVNHGHQALLDGVEARYPGLQLIGCTTHGELSSDGFAEDSVVLMLFHSESVQFRAGVSEGAASDPQGAAQRAADQALEGLEEPARLCIVLSEPYGVDTPSLLGKLTEVLGQAVPVCGGLAAEQLRIEPTYQFCNGKVLTDSLALLIFAGPLRVSTGVASGWKPMGGDHRVTECEGVSVKMIDGEPVKDVWSRYFGSDELVGYRHQVAVYPDAEDGLPGSNGSDFYMSTPFDWNENGGLNMGPPIPAGSRFRFASASREQILAGAESSASRARETFSGGAPDVALVFSCASRHSILGTRVEREYEILREQLGSAIPMIGFYTYGEFCPMTGSLIPRAHASTFVSVLIGEHD